MNNLLTNKFPFAAALLLFVFGMSCSKEPAIEDTQEPDQTVHEWGDSVIDGNASMSRMMFNVGKDSILVERKESTRGTNAVDGQSYSFDANELISIGITGALRGGGQKKDYKVTNTSTGALSYAGTPSNDGFFWKSISESINLRAWSYGNTSTTTADPDNNVYNLETNQQNNGYKELLYSPVQTCSYSANSGGINIQLYHQMARVVITISHTFPGDLSVSSISIGDGSTAVIPTTATFHKPTSGNIGTWDNIGTENGMITPKTESNNTCYSAVLIPRTYAIGTKFICIKNSYNETYVYTISGAALTLEAGRQYNFTLTVQDGVLVLLNNSVSQWGGSATPEATMTDTTKPGDPGISINDITYRHKGYFIASNNKLYATRAEAKACSGNEPYAVVAIVAALSHYFSKFLAIACEDAQGHQTGWRWTSTTSDAYIWAQNHPITINGTTYNTIPLEAYDNVENNQSVSPQTRSEATVQGWRVPSVTDWRYIFYAFCSEVDTYAGGIANQKPNSIATGEGAILKSAIASATGLSNMSGHYWSSSQYSSYQDHAWCYRFENDEWLIGMKLITSSTNPKVRLVFAY